MSNRAPIGHDWPLVPSTADHVERAGSGVLHCRQLDALMVKGSGCEAHAVPPL